MNAGKISSSVLPVILLAAGLCSTSTNSYSSPQPFGVADAHSQAESMVALGKDDQAKIDKLKKDIHDPDPSVRKSAIRALAQIGGPEAAAALGGLLNDENRATRVQAIVGLGMTGRDGLPFLLKALETEPFPRVRIFAASSLSHIVRPGDAPAIMDVFNGQDMATQMYLIVALVQIRDAEAYRALGRLFESSDKLIRFYVINSLADAPPDKRALPILLNSLADEAQEVRMWGIFCLELLHDPSSFPIILAALGDEEPYVRKEAAFILGAFGNKDALPFLRSALNDPEPMVRADAATALASLRDYDSIPLVEQLVHEQNLMLRIRAAEALFRLGEHSTGIQVLLEMVDGPKREYAEEAVRVLQKISNEDFGRDSGAWRDWWSCKEDSFDRT